MPVNTKKQTSWGLEKFTQWLEKRKISCALHTVSPAELNEILRKMFAEVKANKKTDLTSSDKYRTTYLKVDKHPERCRVHTSE